MRGLLVLASAVLLLSGCLGANGAAAPAGHGQPSADPAGPEQVARSDFEATTSGGASSMGVLVPFDASRLEVTVDFGPSAFTDFTFHGIPGCGIGPGSGVFATSSQWTGSCPSVHAGGYQLAWSFSGSAKGTVTVVAVP